MVKVRRRGGADKQTLNDTHRAGVFLSSSPVFPLAAQMQTQTPRRRNSTLQWSLLWPRVASFVTSCGLFCVLQVTGPTEFVMGSHVRRHKASGSKRGGGGEKEREREGPAHTRRRHHHHAHILTSDAFTPPLRHFRSTSRLTSGTRGWRRRGANHPRQHSSSRCVVSLSWRAGVWPQSCARGRGRGNGEGREGERGEGERWPPGSQCAAS